MDQTTLTTDGVPLRRWRPGIVTGVAVSLLLHALLIFGYRFAVPPPPEMPARGNEAMTVWLRPALPPRPLMPPPEPPKPIAKVEPPPKILPKPPRHEDERLAKHANPPAAAQQPVPAEAQAITLPAPANTPADPFHPEQQPKKFDMNAALQTARKVADEKDPARAGLPVAQLDNHPLYPEQHDTQLARGISSAKRGDCKNTGAGLLSPLIWLMDKKDHGCKW